MKTLHAYLTRQVLGTLALTVVVFTFVLLLAHVLKEVLALLVNRQAELGTVLEAIALLIPFVLAFALPMGMLTATLLVLGRFSADQELTAARASGVSLVALVSPILLLSVAMSIVCGWINLQVGPECRVAYKKLLFRLATDQSAALLPEGQFIKDFPGYIVYVGRKRREQLEDVWICRLNAEAHPESYWRAERGRFELNSTNRQMTLTLLQVTSANFLDGRWHAFPQDEAILPLDFQQLTRAPKEPRVNEMTFRQLRAKQRELERLLTHGPADQSTDPPQRSDLKRLAKYNFDPTTPVQVQIHRQVAFSFACIGFTLVGIPLGIRAHRRETSVGVAIALVLVLLYYSFIVLGQALDTRSEWAPYLILWVPNFIFQAVGAVLLWRANRGI